MAHLTCDPHGRRSVVIDPQVGPISRLLHRNDGTRCVDEGLDSFVKYRGHTRTQFTVLIGKLPKTQMLTKKQQRELAKANKKTDNRSLPEKTLHKQHLSTAG